MAGWWQKFELEKSISKTTISEIERYVGLAIKNTSSNEARGAKRLMTLLQTADLHFTVPESDVQGDGIRDSLEDIVGSLHAMTGVDADARRTFWVQQLMQISLMMTGRLVAYRQAINPSIPLTASLRRFINGLRNFVVLHGTQLTTSDDAQWVSLLERIKKDRDQVLVATLSFERKLLRSFDAPMAQMDAKGISVADSLKKERTNRQPGSAERIIELQDKEIASLATLRQGLEQIIDQSPSATSESLLHKSPSHLFPAMTYLDVKPQIQTLLTATPDEHDQVLLLMQKKFELCALQEMAGVLKMAVTCYHKISSVLGKTKTWKSKAVTTIEQTTELYWLQRRTMNVPHNDVDVDIPEFISYLKFIKGLESSNASMWTPSLLKLEDMLQAGSLPMKSIHFVYDTLLIPTYTDPIAATSFWPSATAIASAFARITGRLPAVVPKPYIDYAEDLPVVSFSPLVALAPTVHVKPRPSGGMGFAFKNSSIYAAVLQEREKVRGLLRDTLKAAAKVKLDATLLDVEMKKFTSLILLPFLSPINAQWNTCMEDYLKPMTKEHDDKNLLEGAENKIRDNAITRNAPQRLDNAAASLSSNSIFLIQILKAFRLFMQIGAAFVAQKVFNESYVRKVFSEGRDPPPLRSMLFLMLSIDATAHLMLVLLLVLASFAFKTDTNTFMVDDIFLAELLTEFSISSLVLIVMGIMVADTMRKKRYFQYADQGQVVSAAYRSALLYICVFNFVVPFSVLIS